LERSNGLTGLSHDAECRQLDNWKATCHTATMEQQCSHNRKSSAMQPKTSRAVVLLSGGLDSTTLLHHVVKTLEYTPVCAISFDYNQRHCRELDCARWQAEQLDVAEYAVIDLAFLKPVLRHATALVDTGINVPNLADLRADQLDQPPTYVPNRNMMFLSVAAAYAEARGIRDVFYGAQAQDEYGYWDCTAEFLNRINAVLALNRRDGVTINAPFVRAKKAELLRMGMALGIDYSQTWTCYRGGELACRSCPTCVERLNAFREVGLSDPLEYEKANK
jgi:7-cyano-7-deazaguanine synthase